MKEPSNKQQAAIFVIYLAYFTLAGIAISATAQAVGESVLNPFCEDNKETCAKHYDDIHLDTNDDDAKLSLEANFKQGELDSVIYGLLSTGFGMMIMMPLSCCYSKIIRTLDDDGSRTGLVSGNESRCVTLFKKCKTALPHGKRDAILLTVATIIFAAIELGISVLFSTISKSIICSTSDNSTTPCDETYANLTKSEGNRLLALSEEAGGKMTATGIGLSLIGTLLIPLFAGALVLASKMRVSAGCCGNSSTGGSEEMGAYSTL